MIYLKIDLASISVNWPFSRILSKSSPPSHILKGLIIYITPSLDTPCLYLQKIHIILLCLDGPLFIIYIGTNDLIISISAFKRSTFFTFFFGITLIARTIFVPFFLPFKTLPNEPVPITWVVVIYYILYFFRIKFVVFGDRSLVGFAEPKFIWI